MMLIALVGADGAGKTTIARHLGDEARWRLKYVYMGTAVPSDDIALPTTRLAHLVKTRLLRQPPGAITSSSGGASGQATASGGRGRPWRRLRAPLRVVYRVAEEWFRLGIAWWHTRRGAIILCDRYVLYEYAPWLIKRERDVLPAAERLHMWLLDHVYPTPDLVIMLDAPPEVLFERKPEWTIAHLARQRDAIEQLGRRTPERFRRVDAARPLEEVLSDVRALIARHLGERPPVELRPVPLYPDSDIQEE